MTSDEPRAIDVVVTIDPDAVSVVTGLRRAGMEVRETLASAGVVTGSVAPDALGALRAVDGVQAVEPSTDVSIPPPEAPLQ